MTLEFDPSLSLTTSAVLLDTDAAKQSTARTHHQPQLFLLTTLGLVLRDILPHRQNIYKTTLPEDIALLKNYSVQGRRRMAIKVRLGEKKILSMAALRVDETIADIGRSSREDENTGYVKRRSY